MNMIDIKTNEAAIFSLYLNTRLMYGDKRYIEIIFLTVCESEPFNFSKSHLQSIMEKTSDHPTNMVMLPTGGVLLMSLTPYNDTDSRFEILHC